MCGVIGSRAGGSSTANAQKDSHRDISCLQTSRTLSPALREIRPTRRVLSPSHGALKHRGVLLTKAPLNLNLQQVKIRGRQARLQFPPADLCAAAGSLLQVPSEGFAQFHILQGAAHLEITGEYSSSYFLPAFKEPSD